MPGNPNPSPETRFKPGSTPNPGGKSKELKRLEMEAAEMSARIRHAALSSMMEKLNKAAGAPDPDPDMAIGLINSDTLRLFKDSEDRAHGTPKQTVHGAGDDGEHLHKVSADDAFAAFLATMGRNAPASASSADAHGDMEGDGTA